MSEQKIKTRIINRHDSTSAWNDTTGIPMKGEIIIYDNDSNGKLKIGDGIHRPKDLPFIDNHDNRYYTEPEVDDKLKNEIYESNLKWGGKNFSGSYGTIDAAMIPDLGANRSAFANSKGIIIEYSRDGGATWQDYGVNDYSLTSLFGSGASFTIGKINNNKTAPIDSLYFPSNIANNDQLRITLKTKNAKIYTVLNKFAFYISSSGSSSCKVTIDARIESKINENDFVVFADQVPISGWSGWNIINTKSFTTYGNNPSSQYGTIRFTFTTNGYNSSLWTQAEADKNSCPQFFVGKPKYSGLMVSRIMCFGGVGWTTPSNMAKYGTIYQYDNAQNMILPSALIPEHDKTQSLGNSSRQWSDVYATNFHGKATTSGTTDEAKKTVGTLTFNGAVSGTFNGSANKTITIPTVAGDRGPQGYNVGSVTGTFNEAAGAINKYTLHLNDDNKTALATTIDVKNGLNGKDGTDGTNGTNGKDGKSIVSSSINDKGELVLTYSEGNPVNVGKVVGADGADGSNGTNGAAAGFGTPTVDNINAGKVGTPKVTITASGENTAKVFNFKFENLKGAPGTNGTNGTNGTDGLDGDKGDTGDTYVPSVDVDGNITWTRQNKPTSTPTKRNIKGKDGYGIGSITLKSGSTSAGKTATYSVKQEITNKEIGTFQVYNGANGDQGPSGTISSMTASVSNTTGTPKVVITPGGTPQNRTFNLAFSGLKGEKGADADTSKFVTTDTVQTINGKKTFANIYATTTPSSATQVANKGYVDSQNIKVINTANSTLVLGNSGLASESSVSGTIVTVGGAAVSVWDADTKADSSSINQLASQLNSKQDLLLSGTTIKTINNQSVLGSGNINISGGGTYTLPIASATALGGVSPITKTTEMSQQVGSDSSGRLWTKQSGTMVKINGSIQTTWDASTYITNAIDAAIGEAIGGNY